MKYMGSKSALLQGELGDLLLREAGRSDRFVDLFAGSGSVAHHVAESIEVPVTSADLQTYSQLLSAVVIERTSSLVDAAVATDWVANARAKVETDSATGTTVPALPELTKDAVLRARVESSAVTDGFITAHYGGHYFSPSQALALDYLYDSAPSNGEQRTLALAALVRAASACAAAPGHTAQPFQPTETLLPYISKAWQRDVFEETQRQLDSFSVRHALVKGEALVQDAKDVSSTLGEGDLAFCDPPYSSVQYSRFYHVLEGIARGGWDSVSGAGRSPSRDSRSRSDFSLKTSATASFKDLLDGLRGRQCRVVVTFPDAVASNGMSAEAITEMAEGAWFISTTLVDSVHSTLGGQAEGVRGARRQLKEAVLLLEPKNALVAVLPKPGTKKQVLEPSSIDFESDSAAS